MTKHVKIGIFLLLPVSALLLFYLILRFNGADPEIVEGQRPLMGTFVRIKVPLVDGLDRNSAASAIDKAFNEIARIEEIFSIYKEESEISRINGLKAGQSLKLDDEVFTLIERSLKFNKRTRGAFDITVKPLMDLWGFTTKEQKTPSLEDIRETLKRVGSKNIILNRSNRTISFKVKGIQLDMGGVGKGYATDRAIRVLKDNGVTNAIVATAGDIYCLGARSKKELWKVGIQHPREKGKIFFEIKLKDSAIDTSGDYERYFLFNARRFSHIIDPRTGYPVGDEAVSSTVFAHDSATADAFATALCVLGSDGLSVINPARGMDAIIIIKKGASFVVKMSEGLRTRYDIVEKKEQQK